MNFRRSLPVLFLPLLWGAVARSMDLLEGAVISDAALETFKEDGTTFQGMLVATSFRLWEDRTTVDFTGEVRVNGKRMSDYQLGRLKRPVVVEVTVKGVAHFLTIPPATTDLYGTPSAVQFTLRSGTKIGLDESTAPTQRDTILEAYTQRVARVRAARQGIEAAGRPSDFAKARELYASVVKFDLFPEEGRSMDEAFGKLPVEERPVRTHKLERYEVKAIDKMLSASLDKMTTRQFQAAFEQMFQKPFEHRREGDESYLFQVIPLTQLRREAQFGLIKAVIDTQFAYLERKARTFDPKTKESPGLLHDNTHALCQALNYVTVSKGTVFDAATVDAYFTSLRQKLQADPKLYLVYQWALFMGAGSDPVMKGVQSPRASADPDLRSHPKDAAQGRATASCQFSDSSLRRT
jgi:hypothetical protein